MFRKGTRLHAVALSLVATALLTPHHMFAQRHGGGGGGAGAGAGGGTGGRPTICVHDCATPGSGLSSEDELKTFRRAIAVQANPEQRAAFAKVTGYTQAASDQLKTFRDQLNKVPVPSPLSDRATTVNQALEQARAGNQNFLTSLTTVQKNGLKDITDKLAKADSDLDKEIRALDQVAQISKPDSQQLASSATSLDKALAGFQTEQLALGTEMGIVLTDGQNLTFNLPVATNTIQISGQELSIPTSGSMSRASVENGKNVFRLKFTADLSDLQQNISAILRANLDRDPRCGERIEIKQATLTPMIPASLVVVNLHYERWICQGQATPMEVADSDGDMDVKLTPSLAAATGLRLVSEITRVHAERILRDQLRSGDLGEMLRDQVAASVLTAMQKCVDLNAKLPLPAPPTTTIQNVEFQDAGADQLTLLVQAQLQLTDDQTQQFATQLKQRVSAQSTPAQ